MQSTLNKQDFLNQNLYQIPACTICLQQLSSEIISIACGHCFHYLCITQHFQYRGTCPNCQKRAHMKQVRPVHFLLVLNTKANVHLRSILSTLNVSEEKQMQQLLRQLKIKSQIIERLKAQAYQNQNELRINTSQIQSLKDQLSSRKTQLQSFRAQNLQFKQEIENLRNYLAESQYSQTALRAQLDKVKSQLQEFEHFKKYKKLINQSSQELLKLKAQMQLKDTSPIEMVKQFFQLCQMSKLQLSKQKQRVKDFQQQLRLYVAQLARQKENTLRLEKQLEKVNQKNNLQRKRSIQYEFKYKKIKEKHQILGDSKDSNPFSNTSQSQIAAAENKMNSSSSANLDEMFETRIEGIMKKPGFSGVKFGGLGSRKKSQNIKIK